MIISSCNGGGDSIDESSVNELEQLKELIQTEMSVWNINALAIAMVAEGKIVWSEGFGIHNLSNQTPTSENTLFITSSIAKLVIAVAVMQQVEKGLVDLDEDISTYLGYSVRNPNFPDVAITSRQLMTQRSSLSLPTFDEIPDLAAIYTVESSDELPYQVWVPNYFSSSGSDYGSGIWKNYSPDTQHSSSNIGMALLAYLVEIVSNKDFREYAEDNIFQPLEMLNTNYRMDVPGSFDDNLLADAFNSQGATFPDYMYRVDYAAGFLRSSVEEWSHFLIAVLNKGEYKEKRILEEATVEEMLDIRYPDANLAYGTGIGLIWRELDGWIGHTGAGLVTGTTDLHMTEGKGVIIFSNGRGAYTVHPDPENGKIYDAVHEYLINKE